MAHTISEQFLRSFQDSADDVQPAVERNHAYDLQEVHREVSRGMASDL